jgi:3-hydroxyisobutyrate dehydrogenase-like beta-hydroxyacid dehydrogenase
MQLGMLGLGKMGANMTRRLIRKRRGSGRGADGDPVRALKFAAGSYVCGEDAFRHATEI